MEAAANHKANIEIVLDSESFAVRGVELFVTDAKRAIELKKRFFVAVSGGRTPRRFFELIGQSSEAKALPWDKIELFWVDERCVPCDSQGSNYKLALDTFLNSVNIPDKNIHRIPTEYADSKAAACNYEKVIKEVFGLKENELPEFDLIVLGMGVEGHPGSLFPNCYAAYDDDDLACVVYDLEQIYDRITLTRAVLKAASHLIIMVAGKEKSEILKRVLTCEPDEVRYPIHSLWPVLDKVTWLVDKQAAKDIEG